jgi:hypothetical protein
VGGPGLIIAEPCGGGGEACMVPCIGGWSPVGGPGLLIAAPCGGGGEACMVPSSVPDCPETTNRSPGKDNAH